MMHLIMLIKYCQIRLSLRPVLNHGRLATARRMTKCPDLKAYTALSRCIALKLTSRSISGLLPYLINLPYSLYTRIVVT